MRRGPYRQNEKFEPKGEVRLLFPDGVKCPKGCGSTLNKHDPVGMLQHNCGPWASRAARMGDRPTRSSVA